MTQRHAAALAARYRHDDPDAWDVARAVAGDAQAFGDLVARLEGRVYRFILRQVSGATEAEDLTQDTFLEVYRNLHRFRGASRFSTWVMGIALNLSRNYRTRAPERRYRFQLDEVLESLDDGGVSPRRQAEVTESLQAVQEGIDGLAEELRESLVLVALEGLSYEQAAEIAGIPVGTVKNRVFRARRALREGLAAQGRDDFLEPPK